MKGRILTGLFGLPFAAGGVWALYLILGDVSAVLSMRDWVPVEAQIVEAGVDSSDSSDSTTYQAFADYRYTWQGETFSGDRVSISDGFDNIGDYQENLGRRLRNAQDTLQSVTVYVDPENPAASIVDRDLRWGMLAFYSVFVLLFGGVGFLLLYVSIFVAAKDEQAEQNSHGDAPWLANREWQGAAIRSNSRTAMWVAWGFAAFWNLISMPLPFLMYDDLVANREPLAWLAMLFPVIGLFLIVRALRQTFEWRRFGGAPLTLDPFPGSIGGHVGGTIELALPFRHDNRFELTLTCIANSMSGSGKNLSRSESAQWQDSQIATAETGRNGTSITFRFDIPENLAESDAIRSGDDYCLWRLNLSASVNGGTINRDYDIPVYATATQSSRISDHAARRNRSQQGVVDDLAIARLFSVRGAPGGRELYYPMGRSAVGATMATIFALVFGGAGWFLIARQDAPIFGGIFALIGAIAVVSGVWMLFNSLTVRADGLSISSTRRLFGIPIARNELRRDRFLKFSKKTTMQTQSGGKHVMYYSVYGEDELQNRIVLGEGFRGRNEAKAAMRLFARELGLKERHGNPERPLPSDEPEVSPI